MSILYIHTCILLTFYTPKAGAAFFPFIPVFVPSAGAVAAVAAAAATAAGVMLRPTAARNPSTNSVNSSAVNASKSKERAAVMRENARGAGGSCGLFLLLPLKSTGTAREEARRRRRVAVPKRPGWWGSGAVPSRTSVTSTRAREERLERLLLLCRSDAQ